MAFESDEARRAYFREYNKGWYRRHKERLLEERKQHNQELRLWLRQYKSKLCVLCVVKVILHVFNSIIKIELKRNLLLMM